MRCGGTCHECKDTSLSLDLCKRFGWIQMTANQSEKGVQCLGEDFLRISQATAQAEETPPNLRLRFQMPSPRSFQRQPDIYSRSIEVYAWSIQRMKHPPVAIQKRMKRPPVVIQKTNEIRSCAKELTATVEKLASVIEHMSKSQKSEPVELKPRSRSPRRRHRSSRDSRTPRRAAGDRARGATPEEGHHCQERRVHRRRGALLRRRAPCRGAP